MKTQDYKERVKKSTAFLKDKIPETPKIGIILGSGLSGIADELSEKINFNYEEIPDFPVSTAPGHKGELIFGKLGKNNVVLMNGRFHYYEGYDMKTLTFPIRVMQLLDRVSLYYKCCRWYESGFRAGRSDAYNRPYQHDGG